MNRPDPNVPNIEATLDDLYANEFNVELSWNRESGFHAVFGNPPLADQRFAAAGEAVRWLTEEALRQFPDAEFRAPCLNGDDGGQILDRLCASDIAGTISWTWDGGFYAAIGEPRLADKWSAASAGEALDWLRDQAIRHYPASDFARQHAGFGVSRPASRHVL